MIEKIITAKLNLALQCVTSTLCYIRSHKSKFPSHIEHTLIDVEEDLYAVVGALDRLRSNVVPLFPSDEGN